MAGLIPIVVHFRASGRRLTFTRSNGKGGLTPKIETIAFGTLCRERDCEWQNDGWDGIPKHSGRWQSSG